MPFRDIAVGLMLGDDTPDLSALNYAMSLPRVERLQSRLLALLCVQYLHLPIASLVPLVHAVVDEVNENHHSKAEDVAREIDSAASRQGIVTVTRILQEDQRSAADSFAAAVRLSNICILPRPSDEISLAKLVVERVLFESGRPVLLVPPNYKKLASFERIVIAWDGGARASRAVGDAMSILEKADQVDIVSVSEKPEFCVTGADLAAYLSSRCKRVELTELSSAEGGIGTAIRSHASYVHADLIVMGAFAHSRLIQILIGGTTNDMVLYADRPVFLSY